MPLKPAFVTLPAKTLVAGVAPRVGEPDVAAHHPLDQVERDRLHLVGAAHPVMRAGPRALAAGVAALHLLGEEPREEDRDQRRDLLGARGHPRADHGWSDPQAPRMQPTPTSTA